MFEVHTSEIRKGDFVVLESGRKGKVREVDDRLINCSDLIERRQVVEIGLGEVVFLPEITKVFRRYQPGDWRAA